MDKEEFLVESEFIFHSYIPKKLEIGMQFITKRYSSLPEPEFFFFTLEELPENDENFMIINGAPMNVNIITSGSDGEIIALNHEIGFFDDGNGLLRPITDFEMNTIINQYDGIMNVESDETGDPILYEGKVIISYLSNPENEEEEEVNNGNN